MSVEQEIAEIMTEVANDPLAKAKENIALALQEVTQLMALTNDSLYGICMEAEGSTNRGDLKVAFKRFNGVMRIFLGAAPGASYDLLTREAIESVRLSSRLSNHLGTAASVRDAIRDYKTGILQGLAVSIRRREARERHDDELDDELFSRFLPEPVSPVSEAERMPMEEEDPSVLRSGEGSPSRKRSFSAMGELAKIPKKSKVPELASVARVESERVDEGSSKKVLLTREKLRAGLHDKKGLLDLIGPSTNALERTKKLELLKSAGLLFDSKGKTRFEDNLSAALLRLDLGLGGSSISDSLLFGARVLSIPGYLSKKNISAVENNLVEGSTTWKHQNAYGMMTIAGCLNQAKRIFEKFDEVLYGQSPESLVLETHKEIRVLLTSKECRDFLSAGGKVDDATLAESDIFIKKIVEAVSPIVPITLRNKALDGGYLRTALHLLGAAEFLFAQYEADVRIRANPAGVVGMCASMHAGLKGSALYNEELKPLSDFMTEMRSQYQTSLGLGSSFAKDSGARARKGSRSSRGRSFYNNRQLMNQGSSRYDSQQRGFRSSGLPNPEGHVFREGAGRGQFGSRSMRGRDICFDYRAGSCRRGVSCRYLHANQ